MYYKCTSCLQHNNVHVKLGLESTGWACINEDLKCKPITTFAQCSVSLSGSNVEVDLQVHEVIDRTMYMYSGNQLLLPTHFPRAFP